MWRDAAVVAAKDLRIEIRSRVGVNQMAPFAVLVLVLFAFALDPDRGVLTLAAGGLFWVAVLFTAVLAVQRSAAVEVADDARDQLRLSSLDPAGIFLGKTAAVIVELLALEVLLLVGIVVLYDAPLGGWPLLIAASLAATIGLAASGMLYAVLAAGLRVRDTLLPLLLLPVAAPVLIAGTRAFEDAFDVDGAIGGWTWVQLLVVFAVVYTAAGVLAFGSLLEDG